MRNRLLWLLMSVALGVGCAGTQRTVMVVEPQPEPVSVPPRTLPEPVVDEPPEPVETGVSETTVTGVKPSEERIEPAEKQQLALQARLDRLMIGVGGEVALTDLVVSRLSELGLRCLLLGEGSYDAGKERFLARAKGEPVDLLLVLAGEAKETDRFGNFYSYEAVCKGRMVDAYTSTVISTKELRKRGKRALKSNDAEKSAIEEAAKDLAAYFSDELVRKVEHGLLVVRVVLTRVQTSDDVDRVRSWLLAQKGIEEARLVSWTEQSATAILHVRLVPAQRSNLCAYLETVPRMMLKVTGVGQGVLTTRKQGEEK